MLLEPAWAGIADPIEKVFALLARYRQALAGADCFYGCPIGSLALEIHEPDPAVRELIAVNFDRWVAAVEQCFIDAGRPAATRFGSPRTCRFHAHDDGGRRDAIAHLPQSRWLSIVPSRCCATMCRNSKPKPRKPRGRNHERANFAGLCHHIAHCMLRSRRRQDEGDGDRYRLWRKRHVRRLCMRVGTMITRNTL